MRLGDTARPRNLGWFSPRSSSSGPLRPPRSLGHASPLPLPLAQLAIQQAELVASPGAASNCFGTPVTVSGDTAPLGVGDRNVESNATPRGAHVHGLPRRITPSVLGGRGTISPHTARTVGWSSTLKFTFTPAVPACGGVQGQEVAGRGTASGRA